MKDLNYQLYDIVELRKAHPCTSKSKRFQIIMLGTDVKIRCLGCGNCLFFSRDDFNRVFKKVIEHKDSLISF